MPDEEYKISDLSPVISLNNGDLVEVAQVNPLSETGYTSASATMTDLGNMIVNEILYASDLSTTSKKIIGAINELLSAINDVADDIPENSDFSLSGLSDTTITNPSANQILQYSSNKWQNKPFTLANLTDTTISSASNGHVLSYNGSKWVNTSTATEEITSQVTWNETVSGTNTKVYVKNNVVYLNYQGESKTHSGGDILFTLPSGYRPLNLLYTPFVVNGATFGNFEIARNGQAKINQINDSTATGRIYATVAFPID